MYPILFKPIFKEMIWGGNKLKKVFDFDIPSDKTGEAWILSLRDEEMSIVKNGKYENMSFLDLVNQDRKKFLGNKISENENFPVLIKFIDANDNLSIQVHPNDSYAREKENYPYGKSEMWYILEAPDDGNLIIGIENGVTKEEFSKAIEDGNLEEKISYLPVKKGDIINIPSGLLHAATKGVLILEVQQNSDITYRIYDYNRMGLDGTKRELHVEKSLDVLDFSQKINKNTITGIENKIDNNIITHYINNKFFCIDKYEINSELREKSNEDSFYTFIVTEGKGHILYSENKSLEVKKGDTIFIPAYLSEYSLKGNFELLRVSFS